LLAKDLGFLKQNDYDQLHKEANEVKQMLTNFIKKLKA
jgi:four helix bundle protein